VIVLVNTAVIPSRVVKILKTMVFSAVLSTISIAEHDGSANVGVQVVVKDTALGLETESTKVAAVSTV
jgi:hypothetical protein